MGDDEACAAFHQVIHSFLYQDFCPGVNGTGRFIEDQDFRISQDRSGDGQELLLSLGDVACLLIEFHIVASGQRLDKPMYMSRLCRLDHFLIRGVKPPVADVLHDRTVEEPGVLEHHTEHLPQLAPVEIFYIVSIHFDGSAVYIVEAHQQFDHGRLSGSGRSHDGDLLPLFYLCREIIDDDLIRIVSEMHMVKFHIALKSFHRNRIRHRLIFLCFIQELKDTLGCSCR